MHTDKKQSWENLRWTDKTKLELLGKSGQLCVHRRKYDAHKERNTEEAWLCSGAALLHPLQGVLNLSRVQWNLKVFWG